MKEAAKMLEFQCAAVLRDRIIGAVKRVSNRDAGMDIWQTSFYDHIIRDERDCVAHLRYMEENPAKWLEDPYYKS